MLLNTTAAAKANSTISGLEFEDTFPVKIIKVIAYCILFLVSSTGNLFIIWATSRDIRLRSTTNILIANMAVSDLLVPLFSIPRHISYIIFYQGIWLIDSDFGLVLCKLAFYLQDVSLGVSIYSCVFIALDRFYAVVHPLRGGLSRRKLKYIIPGMWVLSMATFSDYFVSVSIVKTGDSTKCIQDKTRIGVTTNQHFQIYYIMMFALNFGIPLLIISFFYLRIALKLRRSAVPGQAGNTSSVRERQNKNAIKMSAVIVSLFFLSWFPFTVQLFLILFGNLQSLSPTTWNNLVFSVFFIAESSCSYNFFIYLVFTQVYRQNFKNVLSKCTCFNSSSGRFRTTNSFALEIVATVEQEELDVDGTNDLN